MSSNVGLNTPRGSGTSGYVQRNLSHLKPRDRTAPYSLSSPPLHKQRQPDAEILEHERKRRIEVKLFELRDKLEDEGVDEDEIDDQVGALRKKLEKEGDRQERKVKSYDVHDLARRKIEEDARVRRAFGIGRDYEEGGHWKRQEERKREGEERRIKEEDRRVKDEERRVKEDKDRDAADERDDREHRRRSDSPESRSSRSERSD